MVEVMRVGGREECSGRTGSVLGGKQLSTRWIEQASWRMGEMGEREDRREARRTTCKPHPALRTSF